jgi:hypothetical protein
LAEKRSFCGLLSFIRKRQSLHIYGNLAYALYLVPKLRIEELSKADASSFMRNAAGDGINLEDDMLEKAYRITNGNPVWRKIS